MATKQQQIDALEKLLANPNLASDKKAKFKKRLDDLKGASTPSTPMGSTPSRPKPSGKPTDKDNCPDFITEALDSIEDAVTTFKDGIKVDPKQIEDVVERSKFGISNLSSDLKEYLDKTRKIDLKAAKEVEYQGVDTKRPIFDVIISDLEANNNVYLYGGAGTGKTYISKQIAKALNCTLIVINCNQYTSPTELVGGQTIEGFIQGKLIIAWANLKAGERGVKSGMDDSNNGCLILLDELPKIDPNTAGILNDALALVKDTGSSSAIQDSSGTRFEKGRFFCIATGNTRLNQDSTDYVANFKQDLSLQDRFAGSCYELFVDLENELVIMSGYLWIWNYLTPLRFKIQELGYDNNAFVSIRLDQSVRDTWRFWYVNSDDPNFKPKTVKEAMESFFTLFTEDQANQLKAETNYTDFLAVITDKQSKDNAVDFDSKADTKLSKEILEKFKSKGADREI
jgi:cobaltochelatase CobS